MNSNNKSRLSSIGDILSICPDPRRDLDLDLAGLRMGTIVDDIVYVPLKTPLLLEAERHGGIAVDGLGMLLHQAVPGFARWFGVTPSVTPALRALLEGDILRD